ncbi:MAG: DUF4625 domain-containing protein [Saprospirales bacterium]|nr:MAG: DUF4625 domain-containing protein [Saprospirales bacterium]
MLHKLPLLLLLSFIILALSSCDSDDVDDTPPVIEFRSIIPEPGPMEVCGEFDPNTIKIMGGEILTVDALITDDIALSQLKIDIHPNFDCHGHRTMSTEDWLLLDLVDLEGSEVEEVFEFEVPEMVTAGFYHMQLRVVDQAGNSSPTADFWNLHVLNPHDTIKPELRAIEPPASSNFSVNRGEQVSFRVNISDNKNFDFSNNSRVELTYRRGGSRNFSTATEKKLNEAVNEAELTIDFTIPQTLVRDDYLFFLTGYDGVNNESERLVFEVEIN